MWPLGFLVSPGGKKSRKGVLGKARLAPIPSLDCGVREDGWSSVVGAAEVTEFCWRQERC